MKKLFLALIAFVCAVGMASAQKFALVDMEYVLRNVPAYEMANELLNQVSHPWSESHSLWHRGPQKKALSPHIDLGQQVFEGCVELVRVLQLLPGAREAESEAPGPSAALAPHCPLPPHNTHPFSFPSGFQPVSPAKWENTPKNAYPHPEQHALSRAKTPCSRMPGTLSTGIWRTPSLKQLSPG